MDEEQYLANEIVALALDSVPGQSRLERLRTLRSRLQSGTDDPLLQPPPAPGPKQTNRDTAMHQMLAKFTR